MHVAAPHAMRKLVLSLGLVALVPSCFEDHPPDGGGNHGGGGGRGGSGSGSGTEEAGECGEVHCSPKTPGGLDFAGIGSVASAFPNGSAANVNRHIAVGGTHEVLLRYANTTTSFALPYEARSASPVVLAVDDTEGASVTLRSVAPGTTYLRIVDPATGDLYDRYAYASSPFSRAALVGVDEWVSSPDWIDDVADSFVFAPGDRTIGIAYLNAAAQPNRLVDTSATIALAGATQLDWNRLHIPAATLGHHAVAIHVGGTDTTIDLEVTNTADSIRALVAQDGFACFGAYAHGAFISGIAWTFTIGSTPVTAQSILGANCIGNPGGNVPFTVTASAGGQSLTVTTVATQQPARTLDDLLAARELALTE